MEAITAFLWGPLCPLLVWGIFTARPWRYTLMVVVSVGQIYGDVLYYGTCFLEGESRGGRGGSWGCRN
jgi:cholestenol delta-isomerase